MRSTHASTKLSVGRRQRNTCTSTTARALFILGFFVAIIGSGAADAHDGGLDSQGCHTDRRTGEYHCHRAPTSNAAPSTHAQTLVGGTVYSYIDGANVRHYTSTTPPPGARDVRRIGYSYYQRSAPTPSRISQPRLGRSFRGYQCTVDCSGHEAGYVWAERRGIEHPDDCGGNSQSFIEGCMAYAEEVQLESITDGTCEDSDGDELCD